MTLSNWFKIYIFNPVLVLLTKRWPGPRASVINGCVAFFLTFFLVGLWHGTTWVFVLCGILVGIGASVNQMCRVLLRKQLGKKRFDALSSSRLYVAITAAITFAYLCLCVSTLWVDYAQLLYVVRSYRTSGLITAAVVLFLAWLLAAIIIHWRPAGQASDTGHWKPALLMGVQCAVIDTYTFLFPSFGGAFFYEQY